ncbi:hypothetical protein PSD17_02830 [Pseudonocardia sp. D17]|nr:hypothetical protein PSD17_02830 [Pseudonocardia sp. D17]
MRGRPWADPGPESFATKLARLFDSVVRKDRSKRTPGELADALNISESQVQDWLDGRSEPTVTHLPLVAEFFFGSPNLEVFGDTPSSRELNRQLDLLAAVRSRHDPAGDVAPSGDLTPEKLQRVIEYLASSARRDAGE